MGDIADMMIEGFLDCETGELIDGESPGYPRTGVRHRPDRNPYKFHCPDCLKNFSTERGARDHMQDTGHAEQP